MPDTTTSEPDLRQSALATLADAWCRWRRADTGTGSQAEAMLIGELSAGVMNALRNGRGTTTLPWTEIGTLLLRTMIEPLHKGELSVADATERATRAVANALPGVLV